MSILIKGMEMPTSCADCKFRIAVGCCGNLPHNIRMPNCPLTEVPPHGDLITSLGYFDMEKNMNYIPTESEEQATLFSWAAMKYWRLPELRLLFHIANGGARRKSEAARFKAEGVKPGVPDLFLPVARGPWHGLFIELKRQKGGKLSKAQRLWLTELQEQGFLAEVAYGWKEAAALIEDYLNEKGV